MSKTHELSPKEKSKLKEDIDQLLTEIKGRRLHIQEFKKKQIEFISTL